MSESASHVSSRSGGRPIPSTVPKAVFVVLFAVGIIGAIGAYRFPIGSGSFNCSVAFSVVALFSFSLLVIRSVCNRRISAHVSRDVDTKVVASEVVTVEAQSQRAIPAKPDTENLHTGTGEVEAPVVLSYPFTGWCYQRIEGDGLALI